MQQDIYTVSRLNFEADNLLKNKFPAIWISGEISNIARPPSGHIYFVLKDHVCQVRCTMFRGKAQILSFRPKDGLEVLIKANVSLYQQRGEFQLNVIKMTESKEGQLRQQLDQLKRQLQVAGWFAVEHKKPIPKFPQKVGIITSPSGAAIHDILTTFNRRYPLVEILIFPTLVQGESSAENIAKMINIANQGYDCDALIVGRGGGSLEDLWAFNEKIVAQAIFESKIPIISAVGHESDICIADLVADYRAPTPTAAAELLSPDIQAIERQLSNFNNKLLQNITTLIKHKQQNILLLQAQLASPQNQINQNNMLLDELNLRLNNRIEHTIGQNRIRLNKYSQALNQNSPLAQHNRALMSLAIVSKSLRSAMAKNIMLKQMQIKQIKQELTSCRPKVQIVAMNNNLENLARRLDFVKPNLVLYYETIEKLQARILLSQQNLFKLSQQSLLSLASRLKTASPTQALVRGYAIVQDQNGLIVKNSAQSKPGDDLNITLNKGALEVKVQKLL